MRVIYKDGGKTIVRECFAVYNTPKYVVAWEIRLDKSPRCFLFNNGSASPVFGSAKFIASAKESEVFDFTELSFVGIYTYKDMADSLCKQLCGQFIPICATEDGSLLSVSELLHRLMTSDSLTSNQKARVVDIYEGSLFYLTGCADF